MTPARGSSSAGGSGVPTSARGAVLVGVAVILGVVGLQILDDAGTTTTPTAAGTTVTSASDTSSNASTTAAAARAPSQVRVKVYNASGTKGQAQATSDKLKGLGYVTAAPADAPSTRTGTGVQCVAGFDKEAAALATALGAGAVVEPYPSSPPAGATEADCLVIAGKTA